MIILLSTLMKCFIAFTDLYLPTDSFAVFLLCLVDWSDVISVNCVLHLHVLILHNYCNSHTSTLTNKLVPAWDCVSVSPDTQQLQLLLQTSTLQLLGEGRKGQNKRKCWPKQLKKAKPILIWEQAGQMMTVGPFSVQSLVHTWVNDSRSTLRWSKNDNHTCANGVCSAVKLMAELNLISSVKTSLTI